MTETESPSNQNLPAASFPQPKSAKECTPYAQHPLEKTIQPGFSNHEPQRHRAMIPDRRWQFTTSKRPETGHAPLTEMPD